MNKWGQTWTVAEEQFFMFVATQEEEQKLSGITSLRFSAKNICGAENNYQLKG